MPGTDMPRSEVMIPLGAASRARFSAASSGPTDCRSSGESPDAVRAARNAPVSSVCDKPTTTMNPPKAARARGSTLRGAIHRRAGDPTVEVGLAEESEDRGAEPDDEDQRGDRPSDDGQHLRRAHDDQPEDECGQR